MITDQSNTGGTLLVPFLVLFENKTSTFWYPFQNQIAATLSTQQCATLHFDPHKSGHIYAAIWPAPFAP